MGKFKELATDWGAEAPSVTQEDKLTPSSRQEGNKMNEVQKEEKYEDCTPTWEGLLPLLASVFNPSDPKDELRRMSKLADLYVLEHKDGKLSQIIAEMLDYVNEEDRSEFNRRLEEVGL